MKTREGVSSRVGISGRRPPNSPNTTQLLRAKGAGQAPLSLSLSLSLSRATRISGLTLILILAYSLTLSLSLSLSSPNAHADSTNSLKDHSSPIITIASDKTSFKITNLEPDGPAKIDSENITITTDNPAGYITTLSTNSSTDTCLRRLTDGTNCNDASNTLTPANGTLTSPSITNLSTLIPNQWGASITDPTTFSADPSEDSIWFAVPDINHASTIMTSDTATPDTGDTQVLTMGARSDYTLPATTVGEEYEGTVVITAVVSVDTLPTPIITGISPNFGSTMENKAITITGTNLDTAYQVFIDLNNDGEQDSGEECTNAGIDGSIQITCNTPTATTAGTYDVVVKTWGGEAKTSYTYLFPTPTITAPIASQIFAAGTASTTLSVTTNVAGICYHGITANPTAVMTTTGGTSHSQNLTLANNSTNTYYVRCQATTGQPYSSDVSVTFYVRAAAPTLSSVSPADNAVLTFGTISATVTATPSAGSCTVSKFVSTAPGKLSGSTLSDLTNGLSTTMRYDCTAGSGNTQSTTLSGTWQFSVDALQNVGYIQNYNTSNCPTTSDPLVYVTDYRDGHSYIIRKLADGKCWMLTNLGYAGGGDPYYGDVKTLSNPLDPSTSYTVAHIYDTVWTSGYGRTYTTYAPLTRTDGTGQYGYLYNWCAAMGGPNTTGINPCMSSGYIQPDQSKSVCPAGWRLPTGNSGGEFEALNNAVNSGSGTSHIGLLSNWLGVYSGRMDIDGMQYQGAWGDYWSSTGTGNAAYVMMYRNDIPFMSAAAHTAGIVGNAVRCVAAV